MHFELNDCYDISSQLRLFYCRGNTLVRKFSDCSDNIKRILFNSFCGTVYCSSLWSVYTDSAINHFKVAYNNMFRKLYRLRYDNSASEMFAQNHTRTFLHMRRNAVFSLTERLSVSNNVLLRACIALRSSRDHKTPFWHVADFLLRPDYICECNDCS